MRTRVSVVVLAVLLVGVAVLVVGCKAEVKPLTEVEGPAVSAEGTQTTCPVMAGKIDKNLYVDHDGKRIYACCADCLGAMEADPQKYIDELEAKGVELAKTPAAE